MSSVGTQRTRTARPRPATPAAAADFSGVTELPGNLAHREQLAILYTRYRWAARHCRDKDVLEVACGAGQGLGYLRKAARWVVGGDIEEKNLRFARQHYRDRDGIEVRHLDAKSLPFADGTFDTVVFFEAIYYLDDPRKFLDEARRVLRPGGTLLLSSVNCQWHGFNPSPFSVRYYTGAELTELLQDGGFRPRLLAAFRDEPGSASRKAVAWLRRIASSLHLIPKTMKGKALLKRLFYGPLKSIPAEMDEGMAEAAPMEEVEAGRPLREFKMLYVEGVLRRSS